MIKKIADGQSERLDWQQSIVDLMKLLKLNRVSPPASSLRRSSGTKAPRRLGRDEYLVHEQVMTELAESGGVVPETLKHA